MVRAIKYAILLAIIAGVIWYIRSQPIPVAIHSDGTGPVVRNVMGTGTLEASIRTTSVQSPRSHRRARRSGLFSQSWTTARKV
jgi:hypothetical protein